MSNEHSPLTWASCTMMPNISQVLNPSPLHPTFSCRDPAGWPGLSFRCVLRQGWAQKLWPWSRVAGSVPGTHFGQLRGAVTPWRPGYCHLNPCRATAVTADAHVPSLTLTVEEKFLGPASLGNGPRDCFDPCLSSLPHSPAWPILPPLPLRLSLPPPPGRPPGCLPLGGAVYTSPG